MNSVWARLRRFFFSLSILYCTLIREAFKVVMYQRGKKYCITWTKTTTQIFFRQRVVSEFMLNIMLNKSEMIKISWNYFWEYSNVRFMLTIRAIGAKSWGGISTEEKKNQSRKCRVVSIKSKLPWNWWKHHFTMYLFDTHKQKKEETFPNKIETVSFFRLSVLVLTSNFHPNQRCLDITS